MLHGAWDPCLFGGYLGPAVWDVGTHCKCVGHGFWDHEYLDHTHHRLTMRALGPTIWVGVWDQLFGTMGVWDPQFWGHGHFRNHRFHRFGPLAAVWDRAPLHHLGFWATVGTWVFGT